MKHVIIHGTFGSPNENRFPRLKNKLESQGHKVWVPEFPTPQGQTLSARCDELQKQVPFVFDDDTVLIGHSLGATYLLHILDMNRSVPVAKAVFVSGFVNKLGNEKFDKLNAPFVDKNFNWDVIKSNVKDIVIFHGDNDPYVPISEAENLHKQLDGELKIIKGGGHLNSESGYDSFEELFDCAV